MVHSSNSNVNEEECGWSMRNLRPIADRVDVVALDLSELLQEGPHVLIDHSYWRSGTVCQTGEEVSNVHLVIRGRTVRLPLALATRLMFDYLAQHRHRPQSAYQIASGMRHSEFYQRHAMNSGRILKRKFAPSCIKEYVQRIRKALKDSFEVANLKIHPSRVLVSETTVGNEVQYRLRARVEWRHIPRTEEFKF
jgi:hypothetical protein